MALAAAAGAAFATATKSKAELQKIETEKEIHLIRNDSASLLGSCLKALGFPFFALQRNARKINELWVVVRVEKGRSGPPAGNEIMIICGPEAACSSDAVGYALGL